MKLRNIIITHFVLVSTRSSFPLSRVPPAVVSPPALLTYPNRNYTYRISNRRLTFHIFHETAKNEVSFLRRVLLLRPLSSAIFLSPHHHNVYLSSSWIAMNYILL